MAAKIELSGKPCLNTKKGKKSYLIITSDTADTFSGNTLIKSVKSGAPENLEWTGTNHDVHKDGKILQVKLFAKVGADDFIDTPPPDSGKITITLENPTDTSIKDVPVDYIHDTTGG